MLIGLILCQMLPKELAAVGIRTRIPNREGDVIGGFLVSPYANNFKLCSPTKSLHAQGYRSSGSEILECLSVLMGI